MAKKNKFYKSVIFALQGIAHGLSKERNIKIQSFIGLFVIIISLLLKIPRLEFIIILFVCFFVIILELLNTGIEKLVDRISPGFDREYGCVKDIMAGVVLLAVLLSLIIGILILYEPIISYLFSLI